MQKKSISKVSKTKINFNYIRPEKGHKNSFKTPQKML